MGIKFDSGFCLFSNSCFFLILLRDPKHPEFTSRPEKPNPLFLGLLQQIKKQKVEKE